MSAIIQGSGRYTTNFPRTENPISEASYWNTTVSVGVSAMRTTPGLAFGTLVSTGYVGDGAAILLGTWSPRQQAKATVHTINQTNSIYEEVEVHLRQTIPADGSAQTGYEITFRCTADGSQYVQIARWDPGGSYTQLTNIVGPGLNNGDVISGSVDGANLISGYINGVLITSIVDNTYVAGNPGMGVFQLGGTTANLPDYGLTSFTAWNT